MLHLLGATFYLHQIHCNGPPWRWIHIALIKLNSNQNTNQYFYNGSWYSWCRWIKPWKHFRANLRCFCICSSSFPLAHSTRSRLVELNVFLMIQINQLINHNPLQSITNTTLRIHHPVMWQAKRDHHHHLWHHYHSQHHSYHHHDMIMYIYTYIHKGLESWECLGLFNPLGLGQATMWWTGRIFEYLTF